MSRPTVVCLCGSTLFRREYTQAFREEEHAGRICLTVPCYKDDPCCKTPEEQARLDELHLAKIDMADEVLVVNGRRWTCTRCGAVAESDHQPLPCECRVSYAAGAWRPYIGESTRREIAYAEGKGKRVRYLNEKE